MQTDIVCAYQLEADDYFVESGEYFQIVSLESDDDYMDFKVRELSTDDIYPMTFAPFDVVTIVTAFDEAFEFEDVDI